MCSCYSLFAAILVTFLDRPLVAADQWVKLATPNFELYTTAGEKKVVRRSFISSRSAVSFWRLRHQSAFRNFPCASLLFAERSNTSPIVSMNSRPPTTLAAGIATTS